MKERERERERQRERKRERGKRVVDRVRIQVGERDRE